MLPNEAKKSTRQPDSGSSAQNIPDPWQNSTPEKKTITVPATWNLLTETPPFD